MEQTLSVSSDASPLPLSRAQRAYYRLSFPQRLARPCPRSRSFPDHHQAVRYPRSLRRFRQPPDSLGSSSLGSRPPQAAERLVFPLRREPHGFFSRLLPLFLFLPFPIPLLLEDFRLPSNDLSRFSILWLCFLVPNLVAHLVGYRGRWEPSTDGPIPPFVRLLACQHPLYFF